LGSNLRKLRLDRIDKDKVAVAIFPGGACNQNCAIRTLRRLLNHAHDAKKLAQVPKLKTRKESKRELVLDDAAEAMLLPSLPRDTRDVITFMRDLGCRNSEVYTMRWEYVDWTGATYRNSEGKTNAARRVLLLSDRVLQQLSERHVRQGCPKQGWIFPSKRAVSGHIGTIHYKHFRTARAKAGLSDKLVAYSARHDFGTSAMIALGNPAAVATAMGHSSPTITMRYSHPPQSEVQRIRTLINSRQKCSISAQSDSGVVEISASDRKQSTGA
jgi:integrase